MSQPMPSEDHFLAMKRLLNGTQEPVIFDVGAHHGYMTWMFRKLFPKSIIYAFEPFKESFEHLKENTKSDDRIRVFNFGLSDFPGLRTFHCNLSSATNSLLSTDKEGSKTWGDGLLETTEIIETHFETVDSVVAAEHISSIDILKLDVQGAEPLVMAGALETCSSGVIRLIYSEIIIQPTYTRQKRFDEALASFYDNGFDLYNVYNLNHTDEGRLRQVDAIFTKRGE